MQYDNVVEATFLQRPNRFIAHVLLNGQEEIVHVKNTGRCVELLQPGAVVYLQKASQKERKTQWDLIAVKKGRRVINMDSQIPNHVVKEWLEKGNRFPDIHLIRSEKTYKNSRFDFYVEYQDKKAFIEVKGVTLENGEVVKFPDAPSERAVKHLRELMDAVNEGYEAYVIFVVQMKGVRYFTPNKETHPEFAQTLVQAVKAGVQVMAYDCQVEPESICVDEEVPVILENEQLYEISEPIIQWFRQNKRDLPWRRHVHAYAVWVSEIMLQQTRVEAVKPFYHRFMEALPTIQDLADAEEDQLLKLWEGLGYYNRVRNMQEAARQIVEEYQGVFPRTYEEIRKLKGIGSYTAGAISSFAFGIPKPAVDGNVLRVISRILANDEDIMKQSVRTKIEEALEQVIPENAASDFNQGLIELGAMICVPNGEPKCEVCPVAQWCQAKAHGIQMQLPVKKKAQKRKIEKRTILIFQDGEKIAIRKRPDKGLLAKMYEFPNLNGKQTMEEVVAYSKTIGLTPIFVKELPPSKHIFSHIEWHMTGYAVQVDELEKNCTEEMMFIHPEEIQRTYSIPAAFETYTSCVNIKLGQSKYSEI